ncbi:MAG: YkgJ family cysteine cluster protein [Pseudothermotoga sp.]|nr:YkgJ family cysteine cluster protein [Pseudothermotoga sp.]
MQRLNQISSQIMSLYEELDLLHQRLAIGCNGCRHCCNTPAYNIEATMLEFVPLALHLIETGQFDAWFERARNTTQKDRCVLFADESVKREGGCQFHRFRPLVCRLFSASYIRRKNLEVLACRFLKDQLSRSFELLVDAQGYFDRLYDVDPYLATMKRDINSAFKEALEYVGMKLLLNLPPSYPIAS